MKHNKWLNSLTPLIILIVIYAIFYPFYFRIKLIKFYQKINNIFNERYYWRETAPHRKLIFHTKLIIPGDVVIYPDQYSGNLYVINAKGDTIFKYIKKKNGKEK